MNDQNSKDNQSTEPERKSFVSSKRNRKKKPLIVIGVVVLALLVTGAIGLNILSDDQPQTKTQTEQSEQGAVAEFTKTRPVEYTKTDTRHASDATFLALALELYWMGGNVNGSMMPAHNYYPSHADIKDPTWVKDNIKVPPQVTKLVQDGTIAYIPTGCKADQPSGEQNKCTGFSIQVDGKEVAKSKN